MTTSTTSKKLRQKLYIKKYLTELAALIGSPVPAGELLGLEQTAALGTTRKSSLDGIPVSYDIPFADRRSERFKAFVRKLHDANPSPVYVWTDRTIDCGALLVPSLLTIQWDFEFTLNEKGILVFVTRDLMDRLLLDFSEASTGEQRLKIEVQGERWSAITY